MTQTNSLSKAKYCDPILDAAIKNYDSKLCTRMETLAKQHASEGRHITQDEYLGLIKTQADAHEKGMIAEIQSEGTPMAIAKERESIQEKAEQQYKKDSAEICDNEVDIAESKCAVQEGKPDLTRYCWAICMFYIGLFSGACDGYISFDSMRTAGMPLLMSIVYGLLIAISIGLGSHFLADFVMSAKSKAIAVTRFTIGAIVAAVLFYYISGIRYAAIVAEAPTPGHTNEPVITEGFAYTAIAIAVVSWLLCIISTLFAMRVWRNKDERKVTNDYFKAKKILNNKIQENNKKIETRDKNVQTAIQQTALLDQKLEFCLSAKKRVEAIKAKALNRYATTYKTYSKDGTVPQWVLRPDINYPVNSILYVLIMASLWITGCKKQPQNPRSIAVAVLKDVSEPHESNPNIDRIWPMYEFKEYKEQEAYFFISTISDVRINYLKVSKISNGIETEKANKREIQFYREKLISQFYDSVAKAINVTNGQFDSSMELGHSEVYASIATEIYTLKELKASKGVVVVYSDLRELSDVYNSYRYPKKDPKEIARDFDKSLPLPANLQWLTVYLMFKPQDREEDAAYAHMLSVYRILLESKGATVISMAS